MMRDTRGSAAYWDKWVDFGYASIVRRKEVDAQPGGDLNYRPQYIFELAKDHQQLILRRYSRGDAANELPQHFAGLLDAWEEAEQLGKDVWSDEIQYTRHAWVVNLDHYIRCFCLTGLALTLAIPDAQWQRLLALMGNEGEDALLDRVIATRQPGRKVGDKLCFPKAYQRLLEVVEAPQERQPVRLRAYLDGWFDSLKNAGSTSFPKDFRTPSWWDFCANETLGMKGGYFGCWCIEAVAVAKVFGIDDALCLDHPNYPGDLLRDGRSPRHPDAWVEATSPALSSPGNTSWLARLFGKS